MSVLQIWQNAPRELTREFARFLGIARSYGGELETLSCSHGNLAIKDISEFEQIRDNVSSSLAVCYARCVYSCLTRTRVFWSLTPHSLLLPESACESGIDRLRLTGLACSTNRVEARLRDERLHQTPVAAILRCS